MRGFGEPHHAGTASGAKDSVSGSIFRNAPPEERGVSSAGGITVKQRTQRGGGVVERNSMHIPDGMLSPGTCAACGAVMVPVWGLAVRQTRREMKTRQVPLLAALSAFSFTVMLFNVPVVGGTTAHAVGGTLLAVALGPWAAVIGVTVALAIQALLFGDGGVLAFGANCLSMAGVGPLLGYAVYRLLLSGEAPPVGDRSRRRIVAASAGAYAGLNAAALTVALLLGLQPHLAHGPDGKPLYFPFDLSATLPGILLPHLLVAGFVEAAVTAAGVAYLSRAFTPALSAEAAHHPSRLYWALVGAILLAPLGLLAPGTAWGEWATGDLAKLAGYVPAGVIRLSGRWHAPLPDYAAPPGAPPGFLGSALGYYLCAVLGTAVIVSSAALLGRMLTMARRGGSVDAQKEAT